MAVEPSALRPRRAFTYTVSAGRTFGAAGPARMTTDGCTHAAGGAR